MNKITISRRLNRIRPSLTLEATARVKALRASGCDVIALSTGSPDFDTPDHIIKAAWAAMQRGETKYTDVPGTEAVRNAAAKTISRDTGVDYGSEEVMISTGGKQIIFNAVFSTVNAGDEVLIPAPCWVSYPDIVSLAGGVSRFLPCPAESGFKLQAEQLETAVTPDTKWLILNNPCNPSGAVYSQQDLGPLCDVLQDHPHVLILEDNTYNKISFDTSVPASMVRVEPALKERTVMMNSCSKAYAMTGWRIGFCGAPPDLIRAMSKLQGQSTSNAASVSQAAAVEALSGDQSALHRMIESYRNRRDVALRILAGAPRLKCNAPEGALFLFPDITPLIGRTTRGGTRITDDKTFAQALLEEEGVGVVPGSAFMYPNHVRLSFAVAPAALEAGCRRIVRFIRNTAPPKI